MKQSGALEKAKRRPRASRKVKLVGRWRLAANQNERDKPMSMLVVFYWILLLLWVIGAFGATTWGGWPYANAIILLILFVIIGLKILKPDW